LLQLQDKNVMVRHALKIGLKLFREKAERSVTGQQQGQDRLPIKPIYLKKSPPREFPAAGLD
jgi:hypothetical protein